MCMGKVIEVRLVSVLSCIFWLHIWNLAYHKAVARDGNWEGKFCLLFFWNNDILAINIGWLHEVPYPNEHWVRYLTVQAYYELAHCMLGTWQRLLKMTKRLFYRPWEPQCQCWPLLSIGLIYKKRDLKILLKFL